MVVFAFVLEVVENVEADLDVDLVDADVAADAGEGEVEEVLELRVRGDVVGALLPVLELEADGLLLHVEERLLAGDAAEVYLRLANRAPLTLVRPELLSVPEHEALLVEDMLALLYHEGDVFEVVGLQADAA